MTNEEWSEIIAKEKKARAEAIALFCQALQKAGVPLISLDIVERDSERMVKATFTWWKEHPPVHSDPPDGAEVLRTFECRLCRKEVKVVSSRDHRTQFCCCQHERKYWRHDYQRHNSGRTRENQGMSSAMSLGSLIKRERRDLD